MKNPLNPARLASALVLAGTMLATHAQPAEPKQIEDSLPAPASEKPGPPDRHPPRPARSAVITRYERHQSGGPAESDARILAELGVPFMQERSSARHALIVRATKTDGKTIGEIQEDLAIMSRILDKNVQGIADSGDLNAMGIKLRTLDNPSARNLYLEDYGVVFTMRVSIPLLPGEADEKSADKEGGETDTAWEEARNEVFGGPRHALAPGESAPRNRAYDKGAVEDLQNSLLQSLRNASNIRNLKPSDWVTIVVHGPGAPGQGPAARTNWRIQSGEAVYAGAGDEPGERTAVMVLRARKSDIDEFAGHQGDLDGFRQKVSIVVY
jgi:hypothetical protein